MYDSFISMLLYVIYKRREYADYNCFLLAKTKRYKYLWNNYIIIRRDKDDPLWKEEPLPEELKLKRKELIQKAVELRYIRRALEQWKNNCKPRTDIFFAELPPLIWKYMEIYNYSIVWKKYSKQKHRQPKHVNQRFYDWFSAWLIDQCLL